MTTLSNSSMHVIIIGNGISGVSCARYIRKLSDYQITIISGETDYFFSRTALMYIYMGHLQFNDTKPYEDTFWRKNNIVLLRDWVVSFDPIDKQLQLESGKKLSYDKLVIACGSKPNKFGWPGENLEGVQGLYSYQDLEKLIKKTPKIGSAIIVGGGLIGVELAEMLHSRSIPVRFLVREKNFWGNVLPAEEGSMISQHIIDNRINLQLETELKSIQDDGQGSVNGVISANEDFYECQFVGLTTGVTPNIDWLKDGPIDIKRGILIDHFFQTNLEDVYAVGDCAQFREPLPGRRALEQVWYTGKLHGITAAYNICKKKAAYTPGPWFNSAKFFDIEYQTYGNVPAVLPLNMSTFYWQHPKKNIALRLVWSSERGIFQGINTFGIRMKHKVFDQWLREEREIKYVTENLTLAAFDPELYKDYLSEITDQLRSII